MNALPTLEYAAAPAELDVHVPDLALRRRNRQRMHEDEAWISIRQVRASIRELREITSLRQLLDATPVALCRLGFDRAMISRVVDSTWNVERFYSEKDKDGAAEINRLAREQPHRLVPTLFEADIVRRRTPVLVPRAQHDSRVDSLLAKLTGSSSYVAAPIMPEGRVIGFLHADRHYQDREVDRFDLELLTLFADQYGHILERTLLLERLDGLRTSVNTLTGVLNGAVNDCRRAEIDLCPDSAGSPTQASLPLDIASGSVRRPGPVSPDSVLTARELEVLKHMAAGDTNARIATRLVVSEGTVKTHVKHILRKLNAANRAEAVCRWLQREEQPA